MSHTLEPWINLLPSLKGFRLELEDQDWCSNKAKGDTIHLHILKRSFTKTFDIKKNQVIGFLFLLGQKNTDIINKKYTTFT